MEPQENHISYKPSKKFLIRGGIAAGILILILIFQTDWFRGLFNKAPKPELKTSNETIGGLVGKDTNGNSIPDWEEKLWGLDPAVLYTNGISNKQIIEEKKKALGITDSNEGPLNETDILAQQLFSITSAISQSDQNDSGTLSNVGTDIGNSIKFKQVSNRYSLQNIKTTTTTTASLTAYYKSVMKISDKYKDEIAATDILVPALETGDFSDLPKLQQTADSYIAFSKSLQALTVPVGIAEQHLALINGFYGMAQSFIYILEIEDNGVNAVAGISIYKNYALRVDKALNELDDYFTNYGIINS
jgi:hypothetical protein